jgi:hypothetical protein
MTAHESMFPGTFNVFHKGDCASDLSLFLFDDLKREDLEIVGFIKEQTVDAYGVLMVVLSREQKEITKSERSKIMLFLLAHDVTRVVEHVNNLKGATIFYLTMMDSSQRAIIRLLPQTIRVHPDVGMPVYKGVESITAFYPTREAFYETLRSISAVDYETVKFESRHGTMDREVLRDPIPYPEGIVDDPNFFLNLFLSLEDKKTLRKMMEAGLSKIGELLDFIADKLPWLIPILKKIAELGHRTFPYFL